MGKTFAITSEEQGTVTADEPSAAEHATKLSRTEVDKLEDFVKGMGSKGLARAKIDGKSGELLWAQSPLAKTLTKELRDAINARVGLADGDLVFFQFGKESMVQTVMANLRVHLGKKLGLIPEQQDLFATPKKRAEEAR